MAPLKWVAAANPSTAATRVKSTAWWGPAVSAMSLQSPVLTLLGCRESILRPSHIYSCWKLLLYTCNAAGPDLCTPVHTVLCSVNNYNTNSPLACTALFICCNLCWWCMFTVYPMEQILHLYSHNMNCMMMDTVLLVAKYHTNLNTMQE